MKKLILISLVFMLFISAADPCPNKRQKKRLLKRAQVYLKIDRADLALPFYKELYRCDTSSIEIIMGYGIAALSRSDYFQVADELLTRGLKKGNKEAPFYLAQLYLKTCNFELAMEMIERYSVSGELISYDEVEFLRQTINRAEEAYKSPGDYKISLLGEEINSKYSDYTPIITEDGTVMFFTSRREDGLPPEGTDLPEPVDENIYMALHTKAGWQHAAKMSSPVNSATHDATVTLLDNGNKLVFYRTHENMTGGNLLVSTLFNNQWSDPVEFVSSINTAFQESSACVSTEGDLIFFASNRPGGYGGKDIYRIVKLPNGEWSKPLNLGPSINSPFDEDGPIYHEDSKTLYFMSNGHSTIGGFDIFYSQWSSEKNLWRSAENMGYPVNSANDDVYFVLDKNGLTGYFSSDRKGGYGGQDIYKVEMPKEKGYQIVRATVFDGNQPVAAKVTLLDTDTRQITGIYNANPINGKFVMVYEPGMKYELIVEADGYAPLITQIEASVVSDEIKHMTLTIQK